MTTDPKDAEQARKALHKAEKEHCSNFDKGAVFHWAEKGAYVLKADAQAEIARLRMALAESEAAAEGALMILVQTQAERDAALAQVAGAYEAAAKIAHEGTLATEDDGIAAWIRDRIRALTPAAAQAAAPAALEARINAAKEEGRIMGLREAAEIASGWDGFAVPTAFWPHEIGRAILAAAEKENG